MTQQRPSDFVEDMTRLFGSAMGTMGSMKHEMESVFRQQMEACLAKMDIATREEVELLKDQIQALKTEVAALKKAANSAPKTTSTKKTAQAKAPTAKPTQNKSKK